MLQNYIKTAVRNLLKNKLYSLINVLGLAVGITCFTFITLWVLDELSYDRFYPHADRIYRLAVDNYVAGKTESYAVSSAPMAKTMEAEIPEVEMELRFSFSGATVQNPTQDKIFREDLVFTDANVIAMYGLKFIQGDPATAFEAPNSLLLTAEMADKYFGEEDPLGKTLHVTGRVLAAPYERDFQVTGVVENFPNNAHLDFDFFANHELADEISPRISQYWDWYFSYSYVQLKEGADPAAVEAKLPEMLNRHLPAETAEVTKIRLQPVTDIHLHSNLIFDTANGDITNVYLFSAIAVLILLIASVNFMNLATAGSLKRSKEVGVKKVLGAGRKQLIGQFLGESILTSLLAVIVAICFIELLLPIFNQLTQKTLTIHFLGSASIIPWMLALAVLLGFISGGYPAFFLSAFVPVKVLKGPPGASFSRGGGRAGLRKTLIVFQFAISIVLVIGTGVVYEQLDYFRHKKLGFDKEQAVWFHLPSYREDVNYDAFRDKLLQNPGVQKVARASGIPDGFGARHGYRSEGMNIEDVSMLPTFSIDEQYIDLLGLEMVAGREFSQDFISDTSAFILNESAAAHFGWSDPQAAIGQNLHREDGKDGRVVGMVKNFNHASLRQEIEPLILNIDPATLRLVLVKLNPGSIPETLDFLETTFREFFPSLAYEFSFLEDTLTNLYQAEMQLGKIFSYFAFLAIFIACLGLFGLSSFSAEQRTKEIGVRKVLGASISSIILLLSKEFTRLVALAFIIGCPLAYYLMDNWLSDFVYRIDLPPVIFLLAGALALLIALISVSYNAIKAALANPVKALRYE